jgi:hypothetical protein
LGEVLHPILSQAIIMINRERTKINRTKVGTKIKLATKEEEEVAVFRAEAEVVGKNSRIFLTDLATSLITMK